MKKKTIIFFCVIIILILSTFFVIKNVRNENLELSNNLFTESEELTEENIHQEEKQQENVEKINKKISIFDVTEEQKAGVETKQVELNQENCKYSESESKITLEKYEGIEDVVVIPKEINGLEVNKINSNVFENCYNLEIIKIDKDITNENIIIEDFVKNENSQDDEYIEYVTTREYSEAYKSYLNLTEEEKKEQEVVPDRFNVSAKEVYSGEPQNVYSVKTNEKASTSSFDLRDKIEIKVENQNPFGHCYAYATLSAVETNLALNKNEVIDLSEIHLSVLTEQGYGGNFVPATDEYFSSKIGPVLEAEWPMEEIEGDKSNSINEIINKYLISSENDVTEEELAQVQEKMKNSKAVKYVTETVYIPSITKEMKEDKNQEDAVSEIRRTIKDHIVNYGGLYCAFSMNDYTTNKGYMLLNYSGDWKDGHGVTIVGWDDNFSKDNFPPDIRPKEDGAYLALNSWGEDWGNDGYFWISYEDRFVENGLRGVKTVEEITENIVLNSMTIKDINNNETIKNNEIKKGENIQIALDLSVVSLIDNQDEITIKFRNREVDITNQVKIEGTKIENNKSKVVIDIDTREFEKGTYIIEVIYGDETILKQIDIVSNTFEYEVNEDGTSITILGYNGEDVNLEIPTEYLGYKVTKIGKGAFNKKTNIQTIKIYENIESIGRMAFDKVHIIYGYEGTEIEEYAKNNNYTFVKIGTEEIEGDYWKFNTQNNTLHITGDMEVYGVSNYAPWYKYRNSIYNVDIEYDIKEITSYSFAWCENLKQINIPSSISKIGNNAFYSCRNIEKIDIHDNIEEIGKEAFANCSNLKEIKLPSKITEICESTFLNCTSLKKIKIPNGVIKIGKSAFSTCRNLKEIKMSSKITSIGEKAFYNCTELTQIELPEGLISIGDSVFLSCSSLEEVSIPSSVTNIGTSAFSFCISLKEVGLPSKVTSIGDRAFLNCTSLTKIEIPEGITSMGEEAFKGAVLNINVKFPGGETEKTIDMPDFLVGATKKDNILYTSKPLVLSNCEIDTEKNGIKLNSNDLFNKQATISIEDGKLNGLLIKINGEFEELEKIEIKNPPNKVDYEEGEAFDNTGMAIEATYENGTKREITNYTMLNYRYLKIGQKAVTITYTECGITKTIEQEITVTEKKIAGLAEIKILTPPNKITYENGETFDKTGMVVMAYYSDGQSKEITDYTVLNGDSLDTEQTTITIIYTEGSVTKTVEQEITVNNTDKENSNEENNEEENKEENREEQINKEESKEEQIKQEENSGNNLESKEESKAEVIEGISSLLLKSGNNYLKTLSVNAGGSGINFEKDKREYKIEVPKTVEEIEVEAQQEDRRAKIEIIGNKKLMYGRNFVSVVVEAQNGIKRTYTIEIVRQENEVPEIDTTELDNLIKQTSNNNIVKEKENTNVYIIIVLITVVASVLSLLVIIVKKREK